MNRLFLVRLSVEGLYPEGVIFKLKREGIPLFYAQKTHKNTLSFCVERKYCKKVFAILQHSCYNIVKRERFGVFRGLQKIKERAGFLVGAVLFVLLCMFSNLFVLRIEVVGTGDYYREEVLQVLAENGVAVGKRYTSSSAAQITAQILGLQDVGFCSLKKTGSILKVEVQTQSSSSLCRQGPLVSAVVGRVESVTVLRGTALVAPGDEVAIGQTLVSASAGGTVMASARIICAASVDCTQEEVEKSLAGLLLEAEFLQAEVLQTNVQPSLQTGQFCVEITYLVTQRMNL